MSELAPRSNPRLDNFEANKAAKEQEKFENALYGDAGQEDFSEEAYNRVKEADAYERHMEGFASDDRSAHDRGLDRLDENSGSDAMNRQEAALDAKFAASPQLRQMDMISREIHELRNKPVDPDTEAKDSTRLQEIEDRLEELLLKYSESANFDQDIAAFLIDRDDADARENAGVNAIRTAAMDPGERHAAEIAKAIKENPELADDPAVRERLDDIRRQLDEALDGTDKDREVLAGSDPVDNKLSDDEELAKLAGSESVDNKLPSDEEAAKLAESSPVINKLDEPGLVEDKERAHEMALVEEEKRNVTPDQVEAAHEEALKENELRDAWDEAHAENELRDAWDEAHEENEARDRENRPKVKWWKRPDLYLGALFTTRGASLRERYRGSGKMTKIAIGAVAVVAFAGAWKLGAFDFLQDQANNAGPDNLPGADGSTPTPTPTPEVPTPTPTPEVPTPTPEFSSAAGTVVPGEGWYQTFNEMNIPQSEWSNLLEKVGPDLAESGWAYKMPNGEWGISQPGKLPQNMLELIQKNR